MKLRNRIAKNFICHPERVKRVEGTQFRFQMVDYRYQMKESHCGKLYGSLPHQHIYMPPSAATATAHCSLLTANSKYSAFRIPHYLSGICVMPPSLSLRVLHRDTLQMLFPYPLSLLQSQRNLYSGNATVHRNSP